MLYLIGGILLFILASFVRYLALYFFGVLAERKRQKAEAYDIGSFIAQYRNKNTQYKPPEGGQPQALKIKPKTSQQRELPLAPVIADSALAGANVFHQYMLVDDYMYEGVSRMSGEQIDNFSDLSSKIKEYAHNSDGLTEGFLNNLKGHVAEGHAAAHFEEAGAEVSWPEASNQEGWDFLLNGSPVQAKLVKDAGAAAAKHFKEHPDIPIVIPSDAENIPDKAFRFDPSEGVESLADFLKKTPEKAVIASQQLSHAELTENTEQAVDFLEGDIDFLKFPVFTAAFSGFRELRLLRKNETDILSALKNTALDTAGAGIGMGAGGAAGAAIGTFIFPGVGTAIGGAVGSLAGNFFGRAVTDEIKAEALKEALEKWKKSAEKLNRKIKQSEKKYASQFNREKEKEQAKLNSLAFEIKSAIDEKIKNLRKWSAEKEKPSEALISDLQNNILAAEASAGENKNSSWIEQLWPKQQTIRRQIKMNGIKRLLAEEFQKGGCADRGRLFQALAGHGFCRALVLSEIQKTEEERLRRENDLIKSIARSQKTLLRERSRSIKKLANKIKACALKIRKELSPYIKETQRRQNLAQKEAKKLGGSAA